MDYVDQRRTPKRLAPEPSIHESAHIARSELGAWTAIGAGSRLQEVAFGDYSYCVDQVLIHYADIGKFCSIASHVCINPGNHPMWRVTQHHMTYRRISYGFAETDDEKFFEWRRAHKVTIGHDVWIGHGAAIMPGVSVGTGAVVGSGAVVTKDVAPYMIVAGVPAKPIRPRFPHDVAESMLKIRWWDWPRELLEARLGDMDDPVRFLAKYGS